MTDSMKRRAHIVSSFRDAGTGETFNAADIRVIDAGAFANYEAAGLVRAPNAEPEVEPIVAPAAPVAVKPRKARKPRK